MTELLDYQMEFKIPMIIILKALEEKADHKHKQMGNSSRQMETMKEN